jgi:hypothetical protein
MSRLIVAKVRGRFGNHPPNPRRWSVVETPLWGPRTIKKLPISQGWQRENVRHKRVYKDREEKNDFEDIFYMQYTQRHSYRIRFPLFFIFYLNPLWKGFVGMLWSGQWWRVKIKSCKGVSGNKGRVARVLVCSTFPRHLSDGFHPDASQDAELPSWGLSIACPISVSARHRPDRLSLSQQCPCGLISPRASVFKDCMSYLCICYIFSYAFCITFLNSIYLLYIFM